MSERAPRLVILLMMVGMTFVTANLNWNSRYSASIMEVDARGYYAYLPAIFIYDDLNFNFTTSIEGEKYYDPTFFYDYRLQTPGGVVNKYYSGTALLQAPFFLVTHAYCLMSGAEADGYAEPYRYMPTVAALVYLLLGLLAVNGLLSAFGVGPFARSVLLPAMVFGTNLFYYAVVEPGMSHVYSFAAVAGFAYCAKRFFMGNEGRHLVLAGLLLGIVVLIRPVNGLVVLALPFLAASGLEFNSALKKLRHQLPHLGLALALFLLTACLQFLIYKLSTGSFLVYSYGSERMDLCSPHIIDILFSYRKGLFLYTPFYAFAVASSLLLYRQERGFAATSYLFFFMAVTYVLSSWWSWWYGGSFSGRVFIEYLPILVVPLGLGLHDLRAKTPRIMAVLLLVTIVAFCQFQTYQYRYYHIHWSDMTKEKYWDVFLRM